MQLHIPSLLVVLAAAVVAPLVGELTRRIGLSIVVRATSWAGRLSAGRQDEAIRASIKHVCIAS